MTKKIYKKITQFNLIEWLISGYRAIPSLYKTTFWTMFIVLNIVFAYHTAHFLWGNHEWVYMRTGITWRQFWYEARFTETIPYLLFGGELLPVLLSLFAFMGISFSGISLAVYWKLPKKQSVFILFGLIYALLPYNLNWMYHVAQTTFLWGCFIITQGFLLFECHFGKKRFYLWNCLTIILLYWTLGFNAAFINTIFICFLGRILIDLMQGTKKKDLIKKGIVLAIDAVIAGLLLKLTIYMADKYGFLGQDFYNVNTISFAEIPQKLWTVLTYTIKQFTVTYPFLEYRYSCLLLSILGLSLLTILIKLPYKKSIWQWCFLALVLFGILFSTQLAIFLSENRVKLQFMFRLTGYFSLYYVFLMAFVIMVSFWEKQILKNIAVVLAGFIIAIAIQKDMYAMRVWKQGLDAENKLYDHVMTRLETIPEFSYGKRYGLVIVGDPSLRERYYKGDYTNMDKDASVLGWSYRAPWTYRDYFNFYAPQDFVSHGIQQEWGMKFVDKLFSRLSETSIKSLQEVEAWPAKNSVMIRDGMIILFMDHRETEVFKRFVRDYLAQNTYQETIMDGKEISVFNSEWGIQPEMLHFEGRYQVNRLNGMKAEVLYYSDNSFVLSWNNQDAELYVKADGDLFVKKADFKNKHLMASHPAWEAQPLAFISKNKMVRVANTDQAQIAELTEQRLLLKWYAYDPELFVNNGQGVYVYQKR